MCPLKKGHRRRLGLHVHRRKRRRAARLLLYICKDLGLYPFNQHGGHCSADTAPSRQEADAHYRKRNGTEAMRIGPRPLSPRCPLTSCPRRPRYPSYCPTPNRSDPTPAAAIAVVSAQTVVMHAAPLSDHARSLHPPLPLPLSCPSPSPQLLLGVRVGDSHTHRCGLWFQQLPSIEQHQICFSHAHSAVGQAMPDGQV